MIRRTIAVTALAVAFAGLLLGRDVASYLATAYRWSTASVKQSVPIAFEIDRARDLVRNVVPAIRQNMHVIAKEEIEIENLDKQIGQLQQRQDRDKRELLQLRTDASQEKSSYRYGGRVYTVAQVKQDLNNRFERFKINEQTLTDLKKIKDTRAQKLEASRKNLDEMLVKRRKLELEVESLEARAKMVEVAQSAAESHFDESSLGRARQLVADLGTRLQVSERLVAAELPSDGAIPVETAPRENVLDQIGAYFDDEQKTTRPVADHQASLN